MVASPELSEAKTAPGGSRMVLISKQTYQLFTYKVSIISIKHARSELSGNCTNLVFTCWSQQQNQIWSPCPNPHSDQTLLEGAAVLWWWWWCCRARQDSMMSSGSHDWKIRPNKTRTVNLQIISFILSKVLSFFSPCHKLFWIIWISFSYLM